MRPQTIATAEESTNSYVMLDEDSSISVVPAPQFLRTLLHHWSALFQRRDE
jgi:hypothetical protein